MSVNAVQNDTIINTVDSENSGVNNEVSINEELSTSLSGQQNMDDSKISYEAYILKSKIEQKQKEYEEYVNSIKQQEFTGVQREQLAEQKHNVARAFRNTGRVVMAIGGVGMIPGLIAFFGDTRLFICSTAVALVGAAIGLPGQFYMNNKAKKLTNEELTAHCQNKADQIASEIQELQAELNNLQGLRSVAA